jgi:hypothetical protein
MQAVSRSAQTTEPSEHLVQFYDADPAAWARSVGRYLAEGLKRGEAVLVIATPQHRKALARQLNILGCDLDSEQYADRLAFCDAAETLAKFIEAGQPEWDRFQLTVGGEMQRLIARSLNGGFRAYGEMVGVLWSAGEFSAAIRLEECWNRLLQSTRFKLFCGYPINIFTDDFNHDHVDAVVCAHTHVMPSGENGDVQEAVTRALDGISGSNVVELESFILPIAIPIRRYRWPRLRFWACGITGLRKRATSSARLGCITRARNVSGR